MSWQQWAELANTYAHGKPKHKALSSHFVDEEIHARSDCQRLSDLRPVPPHHSASTYLALIKSHGVLVEFSEEPQLHPNLEIAASSPTQA